MAIPGQPIELLEAAVRAQTTADLTNELDLYERLVFHINHGVAELTNHDHDRAVQFLHGLLLNRAFNALWRAKEELLLGYPALALTLARSGFEDWGTLRYTRRHSERLGDWLQGLYNYPKTGVRPPTFAAMWDVLVEEVGDVSKTFYGVLCEFAHPRALGFSWLVEIDEVHSHFRVGPWYDADFARMALHNMMLVATLVLGATDELRESMLGADATGEWRSAAERLLMSASAMGTATHEDIVSPQTLRDELRADEV